MSISFSLLQTSLYSIKVGIGGQTAQEIFRKRSAAYPEEFSLKASIDRLEHFYEEICK